MQDIQKSFGSDIQLKIILFLIQFKNERLFEILQAIRPQFVIGLILYINLLNLSWIKKCLFLRNMKPLTSGTGEEKEKKK